MRRASPSMRMFPLGKRSAYRSSASRAREAAPTSRARRASSKNRSSCWREPGESTAVVDSVHHPLKAGLAALRGVRTQGEMAPEIPLDLQRPGEYVFSRHVEEAMTRLQQSGLGGGKRPAQSARRAG